MREAFRLRSGHDRLIAALAVPALGSLIADPLLTLVDTAFVGRIGSDSLSALGVATAVFGVAFFLFNFLEYGTTAEVARAVGADDAATAGRATVTSLVLATGIGIGVTVILVVGAGALAGVMGASGNVRSEAVTYISIRAFAVPGVLIVRAAHGAYRGYQDTTTPFLATLGINGLNLLLDPILIFGLDMGVAGAAWATLAAQWAGALLFLALLWRGRGRYGLEGARPVVAEVRRYLRAGRDLAVRSGALLTAMTFGTAVATRVSDEAIAAHQVLFQVFIFLALSVDALAIAAQALVGKQFGSGDRSQLLEVADRMLAMGVAVGFGLAAILAALEPFLGGWFTDDPAVLATMGEAYWLLVLMQPAAAVAFVWDGVFIGAGDFGFLAAAMVVSSGLSVVLLALVLPFGWGLPGVWWALIALMVGRILTLGWRRWGARSPLRDAPDGFPASPAA